MTLEEQDQAHEVQQQPTVFMLTAKQYETMMIADKTYHEELVRAYGEQNAGDMRYQFTHDDPAVQAAAEVFRTSADEWRKALTDARNGDDLLLYVCPQCDEEYRLDEDVEYCPVCGGTELVIV